MKRAITVHLSLCALVLAGCGGKQSGGGGVGDSHVVGDDEVDLEPSPVIGTDGGVPADAAPPDAAPAPITFRLVNNAPDRDLVFSMDRGWQPVVTAYSGEPPNATPILMFPTHCTESCQAPAEEVCPVCEEPKSVKAIKEAEKREVVPPGESLDVPWDMVVYSYEKTKGTRDGKPVSCQCYVEEPAPPNDYTVRVVGLRITSDAEETSKMELAKTTMTLPPEEPTVIELEFPPPEEEAADTAKR